jgi:hypothetical protein
LVRDPPQSMLVGFRRPQARRCPLPAAAPSLHRHYTGFAFDL